MRWSFLAWFVAGALFVPGCSDRMSKTGPEKPEKTTQKVSAVPLKLAPPVVSSITTRTVDTTKLADTALAIRVRNTTILDSTRYVRISLPAEIGGIPYGPSEAPLVTLCDTTYGYTGTILGIGKAKWVTVLENGVRVQRQDTAYNRVRNELTQAELDSVAACRGKASLRIARKSLSDPVTGKLSVAEALREIRTWPKQWAQHPAFLSFHLGDDPASTTWGYTLPVRMVMWDSIACGTAQRFGKQAPLWLRARPIQMEQIISARPAGTKPDEAWQCMTTAMAQWVHRLGNPGAFFRAEDASAKKQKLGVVHALNLLAGGCGNQPASIRPPRPACFVPGTTRPGAESGTFQMSAQEITFVGDSSLLEPSDPYPCAHISWSWWENWKSPGLPDSLQVQNIPENKVALLNLAKKARAHPVTSCIQR